MGIPDAALRPAPHRTKTLLEVCRCLMKELISDSKAKVGVSVVSRGGGGRGHGGECNVLGLGLR